MPPRSLSVQSAHSVLDWQHDNDAYVSTYHDGKSVANPAMAPLTPASKSVHWSEDKHTVFFIPHLNDFSDEEVAAIWYEPVNYAEMKSEYKGTVFLIECGTILDEQEHTARGLEYRTQEGAWARYENKRDAYNAVLDEQDIQWKEDSDDPEELRNVYLQHSTKCSVAAHQLACKDALEAQAICAEASPTVSTVDKSKPRGVKKNLSIRRMFGGSKK